jgi:hypothetical protein
VQEEPGYKPYILNALHDLEILRSTVHDGLTGQNDLFLKSSLIQDIDAVESNLRKALQ